MAKPELGKRHRCYSCGCAFYDLGKPAALCPRCGADQATAPKFSVPSTSKASIAAMRETPIPIDDDEVETEIGTEFDEFGDVTALDEDDVEISEEEE